MTPPMASMVTQLQRGSLATTLSLGSDFFSWLVFTAASPNKIFTSPGTAYSKLHPRAWDTAGSQ